MGIRFYEYKWFYTPSPIFNLPPTQIQIDNPNHDFVRINSPIYNNDGDDKKTLYSASNFDYNTLYATGNENPWSGEGVIGGPILNLYNGIDFYCHIENPESLEYCDEIVKTVIVENVEL